MRDILTSIFVLTISITLGFLSVETEASPLIEMMITEIEGDCGDNISLVAQAQSDRLWIIQALFDGDALELKTSHPGRAFMRRCRFAYRVQLPDEYAVKWIDYVAAGQYSIPESGKVGFELSHKILGSGRKETVSAFSDPDPSGEFYHAYERIEPKDLPPLFQYCSSTFHAESALLLKARQEHDQASSMIRMGKPFYGATLMVLALQPCFEP